MEWQNSYSWKSSNKNRPFVYHLTQKKSILCQEYIKITKLKLRGLSPHANYTNRAAAAGRRS